MRGEAHLQRGTEIRYYRCPTVGCHARRCPAELLVARRSNVPPRVKTHPFLTLMAVVSAILIVVGRVNHDQSWGTMCTFSTRKDERLR
jgi:hypothetical protein